jgi:hypothetical protein
LWSAGFGEQLGRRRPFRPPEGVGYYEQIQRFGLVPAAMRFAEGRVDRTPVSPSLPLYRET